MRPLAWLAVTSALTVACSLTPAEEATASHVEALAAPASSFHVTEPARVLDTRLGAGAIASGESRCVDLSGAVPVGATAVVVNVTATNPTAAGYVTLWGAGSARPATSNVNFRAGETAASAGLIALTAERSLCAYQQGGSADVILDVAGYFGAGPDGAAFHAAANERLLDTRAGGGQEGDLVVRVPGPRASAAVVNLTSTDVIEGGYLTAYASGRSSPATSNLNVMPGATRANLAFVALGPNNTFTIDRRAHAHVIVDLVGVFRASSGDDGLVRPLAPVRAYDSRAAGQPLLPGEVRAIPMLPPGAAGTGGAVFVTVTAVEPTKEGFLTVGATSPVTSTLNFVRGQTVANLTATWVTQDGIGYVYNSSGRTHVVVDVFAAVSVAPTVAPPIPPIPPEAPYDVWTERLRARGHEPNVGGVVTVVGVRGEDVAGSRHETRVARVFDDTFAVLLPSHEVITLAGSTHPWFADHTFPVDADRDGRPDVGMIKPGQYWVSRRGSHYGAPAYWVRLPDGDDFLPGWRNTDHDDVYGPDELAASDARGDRLNEILFHAAGPGSLAPIGCQVFSPADMNRLADLAGDGFEYLLIDP